MSVNEEKRAEGLAFLNRWAHDSGADAVSYLEGRVAAVVRFPFGGKTAAGRRMLITGDVCGCGQPGCEGWKVAHQGVFSMDPNKPDVDDL